MGRAPTDRLRMAVFDCDGTLIDSFGAIVAALQAAWRSVGRQPPAEYLLRQSVGLPLEGAVMRLDTRLKPSDLDAIAGHYRNALAHTDNILMPGVREALGALQDAGMVLGVATGMGRPRLDAVLARHGLVNAFVTLQTGDSCPGKPSPEMLRRAMREAGTEPEYTVMIGDAVHDMAMARNAGVAGIGVTWGATTAPPLKLAGAVLVIEDFADLGAEIFDLLDDAA